MLNEVYRVYEYYEGSRNLNYRELRGFRTLGAARVYAEERERLTGNQTYVEWQQYKIDRSGSTLIDSMGL
jgi:hypothetical protein